jgi:hypothetical protein
MDLGNVPTAQRSRRDHQPSSQVVIDKVTYSLTE